MDGMRAAAGDQDAKVAPDELIRAAAAGLDALRERRPRVHALTNFVAMNVSANVMLAAGAVPSMTFRADAMADFVESSTALLVNLGQLDPEREAAVKRAVPLARKLGRPWVLDPVKVERSTARHDLAAGLVRLGPAVLRANRGEVAALAHSLLDLPEPSDAALGTLAREFGMVVAATGETDIVTDGSRLVRLQNGSPLMDRVTAMGCASSALLACFLSVVPEPLLAAAAALLAFGVAGEIAAGRAAGPGTFEPHLLDALYAMDAPTLQSRARIA